VEVRGVGLYHDIWAGVDVEIRVITTEIRKQTESEDCTFILLAKQLLIVQNSVDLKSSFSLQLFIDL
jgi:hypothetical protein